MWQVCGRRPLNRWPSAAAARPVCGRQGDRWRCLRSPVWHRWSDSHFTAIHAQGQSHGSHTHTHTHGTTLSTSTATHAKNIKNMHTVLMRHWPMERKAKSHSLSTHTHHCLAVVQWILQRLVITLSQVYRTSQQGKPADEWGFITPNHAEAPSHLHVETHLRARVWVSWSDTRNYSR